MNGSAPEVESKELLWEIPVDVAASSALASLRDARYRDFLGARRKLRAEGRRRAAQLQREAQASAGVHAGASAHDAGGAVVQGRLEANRLACPDEAAASPASASLEQGQGEPATIKVATGSTPSLGEEDGMQPQRFPQRRRPYGLLPQLLPAATMLAISAAEPGRGPGLATTPTDSDLEMAGSPAAHERLPDCESVRSSKHLRFAADLGAAPDGSDAIGASGDLVSLSGLPAWIQATPLPKPVQDAQAMHPRSP